MNDQAILAWFDNPWHVILAGALFGQLVLLLPESPFKERLLNMLHGFFPSPQVMSGSLPTGQTMQDKLVERLALSVTAALAQHVENLATVAGKPPAPPAPPAASSPAPTIPAPPMPPTPPPAAARARLLSGVILSALLLGCSPSLPSPTVEGEIASYEAQSIACERDAGTRAEAEACRCGVRVKFGRPCYPDGGAP